MFTKTLITIYTALAFVAGTMLAQAQASPVTVATIKANVQIFPDQIRSMSCIVKTTTTFRDAFFQANNIPTNKLPPVQIEQGEWAFKANKVIDESHFIKGDSAPAGHDTAQVNLFDGNSSYHIKSENGGLASRGTYGSREHQTRAQGSWNPLQFGYQLDNQWLSSTLNNIIPTVERVGNDPIYGQLYVLHLNSPGKEDRIWFAPKFGNIAVKIVEDTTQQEATYAGTQYKRNGNFWLPLQGEFQLLTKQQNGQTTLQVDKKFVFSNIRVNAVSDDTFDFQWPTGAALYDNDTRTKYWRDVSGKWIPRTDLGKVEAHSYNHLSAADIVPWVFFVCLTALFTLGFIRWRHNASV